MSSDSNNVFFDELEHFSAMFTALTGDVESCHRVFQTSDCPTARRNLIRSVFAYIEGCVYRFKQLALTNARRENITLTAAEICALEEEGARVDEDGNVKPRMLQITCVANLRLVLTLCPRCLCVEAPVALTGQSAGWTTCKRAVKVRHRLTHPKDETSLIVTDEEIRDVMDTFQWATSIFTLLLSLQLRRAVHMLERKAKLSTGASEASEAIDRLMKPYQAAIARIADTVALKGRTT